MTQAILFWSNKTLFCFLSVNVPEKLDHFINKYAEHSHEKWSMEKVMRHRVLTPSAMRAR